MSSQSNTDIININSYLQVLMGNTYIKNAYTEEKFKRNDRRRRQQKEKLKVNELESVDIMTSEAKIDELYQNVVQNVRNRDFFFPEAFSNCTNLFYTGPDTTEEKIKDNQVLEAQKQKLLSGRLDGEAVLNQFNKQYDEPQGFVPITPEPVFQFTFSLHKRFAIMYSLFAFRNKDQFNKKNDFLDYLKTFLSREQKQKQKKGQQGKERMKIALDQGFKFVITLFQDVTNAATMDGSGKTLALLQQSLENLHQMLKETETGALHGTDQQSFIIDANLDQARAYLLSVLSHPQSPHNLASIVLRIIYQIGRVRSNIEDMLVVCDCLDKNKNIDLREDLQHLKVVGEFKEEEEKPVEQSENFIDPPSNQEDKLNRVTVHKTDIIMVPKDSCKRLFDEKTQVVSDGTFMYVQGTSLGLMKVKITQDSFVTVLHKPEKYNSEEMRLTYANGRLFLRNLHTATYLENSDETGAIQLNCETFEEYDINAENDEEDNDGNDSEDQENNNEDEDDDNDEDDEDNDDEDNNSYGDNDDDNDEENDDEESDSNDDEEEDGDEEKDLMFLECDEPAPEKMIQETPIISDGRYIYAISMKFTQEEIEKHQDDSPGLTQIVLFPMLQLEMADPHMKGELAIFNTVKLMEEDGINFFKFGCYKDTREILALLTGFVNGTILCLNYEHKEKKHSLYFEISSGKLIHKEIEETKEEDSKGTKTIFDPVKGVFIQLKMGQNDDDEGKNKMEVQKFTLAGFGKNPNAVSTTVNKDEALISRFQQQIYSDFVEPPKEQEIPEKPTLYTNLFDRYMFQTPPVAVPPKPKVVNQPIKDKTSHEIMKTMILFSALKGSEGLKKVMAKKKSNNINLKQMQVFKYKNLTCLRGQTFELLMNQLFKYTAVLGEAKTKDNLPQQYNLLYLLELMALNLQCLDICNNDLLTLFNQDHEKVSKFVHTLNDLIFPLLEQSFNQENFESAESAIKNLWTVRLKAIANTFMLQSIQYLYKDKDQMLSEIQKYVSQKEEAKVDDSKGEMLITHLLESQDNMRRFVRGFNPQNCDVILDILCEALYMLGAQSVERIEKQNVKADKKLQQLQKFVTNLIEQIVISYSSIDEVTETKIAIGGIFIKLIEHSSVLLKDQLEKGNQQFNVLLDNIPADFNKNNAKTWLEQKTDILLKHLLKDSFFVKFLFNLLTSVTLFAQRNEDNIYKNIPASLLKVRQSILLLLEPYEYFNRHILEKRNDKIPQFAAKEQKSMYYTIEEFEELSVQDKARVIIQERLWTQIEFDQDRGVDIDEFGFEVDPWTKRNNPDNFDMRCHGKCLFGYCMNHDKAGCSIKYETGYMHWSYKQFFCTQCIAIYKLIKQIKEKKQDFKLKRLPEEIPTFEFKKFNDQFSRQLCWFLGQIAGQLIIINPEKPIEEGKEPEDKKLQKDKEIKNMVLNSKLLSGGINRKFIDQVFTKKTQEIIGLYSLEKLDQSTSLQSDETYNLLSAVIQTGQNDNVDKLIANLQLNLERKRPIVPSARVGGELGLRVSRAAFGAILKFSDLTESFASLVDEIDLQSSMNVNTEQDSILQGIKEHIDFKPISKRWEMASRIRIWFQEQRKVILDRIAAEIKKENADLSTDDLDQIAYIKFEDEYQQLVNKIVEKGEFLLKLNVPNQIFTKEDEDLEAVSLLQKCSCGKDHSMDDHEAHPDLKDRLHHIKTILTRQASAKPQQVQKKELFESAVSSVLVYLQVPIELIKVQESIEKNYIKGLYRAYGLHIIGQILLVETLPKTHKQDLMNWFTSSLRAKKYEVTYYLDELKGCGAHIENQIRNQFFSVIRIILSSLKISKEEAEIKNLMSVLQWKFFARDHQALKQSGLLSIIYDQGHELLQKSWGTNSELSESIMQIYEHIMHSIIARLIKQDERSQQETSKIELKLEKKQSQVDSNATEGLLNQCFEIIFKELARYLADILTPTTIDFNTFLKVRISKQNLPFDFTKVKSSKICGPDRHRNKKWCNLSAVQDFKEMPWIKELKVFVTSDNYVDGVHVFYEQSDDKRSDWKSQQERNSSQKGSWISFEFQKGEYINKVFFRTGGWMDQIIIETNKGRDFKFGGEGGTKNEAAMLVSPGMAARVVSFGGQHYSHMESMIVHYVEVDPSEEEADQNQDYIEFLKNKAPKIKDCETDWLLQPQQETEVPKTFIAASGIVEFVRQYELQERKSQMIETYEKTIKMRQYTEQFIKRLLRTLEKYTSVASINILKYLEPLQRPAVIKNLLSIFQMSEPSLKLQSLSILYNLIEAKTPHFLLEKGVAELKMDQNIPINRIPTELQGSEFLQFFYDYLVQSRKIMWSSTSAESPGSYTVTSEIERMLTKMIAVAPQEELRLALKNKIRSFLSQPIESWKIEEADVILSLIETSGQFMSMQAGSHVVINKTNQHCIILGFSSYLKDHKDFKSISPHLLKSLRPSPYLQDMSQKALLLFKGPSHDITLAKVYKLTPEYCDSYHGDEEPMLDGILISKLIDVICIKQENHEVAMTQIKAQILKILPRFYHLEGVQEVIKSRFAGLLENLERFNNQEQTVYEAKAKLPVELLEARISEIRAQALETPNCIVQNNIITAQLSRKCNSLTFFVRKEGFSSKIVMAGVSESFNEGTLWKAQFFIEHSVTLFQDVQNNPILLTDSNFDILVIDSADLEKPRDLNILVSALSNSSIIVCSDNFDEDASKILASLRKFKSRVSPPLDHKPIFVIDHESYMELCSLPQAKTLMSKTQQMISSLSAKEEAKEPIQIKQQKEREKEYIKDENNKKQFQEKPQSDFNQQIRALVKKATNIKKSSEYLVHYNIRKNKINLKKTSPQVYSAYAKIFEPAFIDKNEYHSLQNQILKYRSRELMFTLVSYYQKSPRDRMLSEKYLLTVYNDAVNKKTILRDKEAPVKIVQQLTRQFNRNKQFAEKFVEDHLLKAAIPFLTKLTNDSHFAKDYLDLGYFTSQTDAEAYPLPSLVYDLSKSMLQNETFVEILAKICSPQTISDLVTFLVSFAMYHSVQNQNSQFNQSFKYFALAIKIVTTVRTTSQDTIPAEAVKALSENRFITKLFKKNPSKDLSQIIQFELPKLFIELGIEINMLRKQFSNQDGIKWYMRSILKNEYLRSHDIITYFRVYFAKTKNQKMLKENVDKTKIQEYQDILITDVISWQDRSAIIAMLTNTLPSEVPVRDLFLTLLTNEKIEEFTKLARKSIDELSNDDGFTMEEIDEKLNGNIEDCKIYLFESTLDCSLSDNFKKMLDKLKGKVDAPSFDLYRHAYKQQVSFFKMAKDGYERISARSLKDCHPESLPYLRKKMLRDLPKGYINNMVKTKIDQLNNREDSAEFEVDIYRHKAFLFIQTGKCDVEAKNTIFGQLFQWSKKFPDTNKFFRMNDPDSRAFVINFKAENSRDGGGPYREAMVNICNELQSSSLSILAPIPNNKGNHGDNRECWMINSGSESDPELFKFFGMFIGFAIRASQSFPLDLAPIFWKSINKEIGKGFQSDQENEQDLKAMDLYTYQMLENLRQCASKMTDEEFEQEVQEELFTTTLSSGEVVQLCPGGFHMKLNKDNLQDYIRLVVNTRLGEYENLMRHVREGIDFVIPLDICNLMSWKLLEERATGSKTIDIDQLKRITDYTECKESDPFIQIFWKVLESFTDIERSKYLKFVWGRARLPSQTEERHEITAIQYRKGVMPKSHTCFFTLDLPRYPTFEEAREKILYSVMYCGDIDGDNMDY